MLNMKYILILIFLIPFHVNAQNDFNIPDSLVRNSAAFYTNWASVYNKMKESSSFQQQIDINPILKKQFDSASLYRKKYVQSIKLTIVTSFVPFAIYLVAVGPISATTLSLAPIAPILFHLADQRRRRFFMSEFVKYTYNAARISGIETKFYNWEVKNFHTLDYIKFNENGIFINNKFKSELAEDKSSGTVEEKVEKLLNLKKNGSISEKEFKRQMKEILNKKE